MCICRSTKIRLLPAAHLGSCPCTFTGPGMCFTNCAAPSIASTTEATPTILRREEKVARRSGNLAAIDMVRDEGSGDSFRLSPVSACRGNKALRLAVGYCCGSKRGTSMILCLPVSINPAYLPVNESRQHGVRAKDILPGLLAIGIAQ